MKTPCCAALHCEGRLSSGTTTRTYEPTSPVQTRLAGASSQPTRGEKKNCFFLEARQPPFRVTVPGPWVGRSERQAEAPLLALPRPVSGTSCSSRGPVLQAAAKISSSGPRRDAPRSLLTAARAGRGRESWRTDLHAAGSTQPEARTVRPLSRQARRKRALSKNGEEKPNWGHDRVRRSRRTPHPSPAGAAARARQSRLQGKTLEKSGGATLQELPLFKPASAAPPSASPADPPPVPLGGCFRRLLTLPCLRHPRRR